MWDKLGLNFSEHQETMEYQLLRDGRGGRPLRHFHLLVLEPSDLPFSHVPRCGSTRVPKGLVTLTPSIPCARCWSSL